MNSNRKYLFGFLIASVVILSDRILETGECSKITG